VGISFTEGRQNILQKIGGTDEAHLIVDNFFSAHTCLLFIAIKYKLVKNMSSTMYECK
jgi:hypothetical protein